MEVNSFRLYPPPFFSLCSFRLTMTAVICWSMKMRMEASSAGTTAAIEVHHGFGSRSCTPGSGAVPKGWMNHCLPSQVGRTVSGTCILGVGTPTR